MGLRFPVGVQFRVGLRFRVGVHFRVGLRFRVGVHFRVGLRFRVGVHFRVGLRFRFGVHFQVGLRLRAVFVFEKVNTPPNSKNFVLTHSLTRAMISTREIMEFLHHLNLQFRVRFLISQLNASAVVRYNMLMQRPT